MRKELILFYKENKVAIVVALLLLTIVIILNLKTT
jgi:hypothetical protein